MAEQKKESWLDELDEDAVARESERDISPRLDLPDPGDKPVVVQFAEKQPRKVTNSKLPNGYAWFIGVNHEGVKKSMVCPMSILQHVAAIMKRENIGTDEWNRLTVLIGAQVTDIERDDGSVIQNAKVYWTQLVKQTPRGGMRSGVAAGEL